MIPDWCDIVVVKPTDVQEDVDVQRGACGRVYINGVEIKHVSKLTSSDIIGDEDIPSVTITIEPRSFRVMSDVDFEEQENQLVYNGPRRLIIRKKER